MGCRARLPVSAFHAELQEGGRLEHQSGVGRYRRKGLGRRSTGPGGLPQLFECFSHFFYFRIHPCALQHSSQTALGAVRLGARHGGSLHAYQRLSRRCWLSVRYTPSLPSFTGQLRALCFCNIFYSILIQPEWYYNVQGCFLERRTEPLISGNFDQSQGFPKPLHDCVLKYDYFSFRALFAFDSSFIRMYLVVTKITSCPHNTQERESRYLKIVNAGRGT